jgi:hypothetical protein
MTTAYTSLLGLALPVTGELSGTWGDTVNASITSLLDAAVAGTTTLSTDADVTLTTTSGADNQAREAIIIWNPASGSVTRNITAPARSKAYIVINATGGTQSIVLRGAGPTTGVTIAAGEKALCAWNGSDFVKISNVSGAGVFTSITDSGLTSGRVTYAGVGGLLQDSTNLTFNGTTLTAGGFAGPLNGTVGATTPNTGAFTTLSASGTATLSGLTASTNLALDASKNVVSITNTGTGNNVLSASPTLTGTVDGASLSLSSLTSGRVTYAGTSGLLQDSASLTFNGTTLTAGGFAGPGTGLTGTASGLSIGGNAATTTSATTSTNLAGGTANQLPYQTGAGATNFIAAPTVASTSLTWNGSAFTWATAGTNVTVSNDTSTASNLYPLFATTTSGTVSSINTSNAKLLYKPSTGDLQASQVVASNGIVVNSNTVAASYSIPSGSSAMSVGPMTVASGQSVTIPTGSRWLIL